MTPDALLDLITNWLDALLNGDAEHDVERVPEGVIVLAKSGAHVLIEAHAAFLKVA